MRARMLKLVLMLCGVAALLIAGGAPHFARR